MSSSPPPVSQAEGAARPPEGALSSELPQRPSGNRSPSVRASRAPGAIRGWRRTEGPGTSAAPRLRARAPPAADRPARLARRRFPIHPEPSPPQPGLAELLRPPGAAAAAAAAAAPAPAPAPAPARAQLPGRQDGRVHEGPVHGQGGRRGRRGENQTGGHRGRGEDQGGRPLCRKQDSRGGGTRSGLSG